MSLQIFNGFLYFTFVFSRINASTNQKTAFNSKHRSRIIWMLFLRLVKYFLMLCWVTLFDLKVCGGKWSLRSEGWRTVKKNCKADFSRPDQHFLARFGITIPFRVRPWSIETRRSRLNGQFLARPHLAKKKGEMNEELSPATGLLVISTQKVPKEKKKCKKKIRFSCSIKDCENRDRDRWFHRFPRYTSHTYTFCSILTNYVLRTIAFSVIQKGRYGCKVSVINWILSCSMLHFSVTPLWGICGLRRRKFRIPPSLHWSAALILLLPIMLKSKSK